MGHKRTRPLRHSPSLSIVISASRPAARASLHGIAAAPGRVVAPVWRWSAAQFNPSPGALTGAAGVDRLHGVIDQVRTDLAVKTERLRVNGLTAESGILEAQALMLDDPALLEGAIA